MKKDGFSFGGFIFFICIFTVVFGVVTPGVKEIKRNSARINRSKEMGYPLVSYTGRIRVGVHDATFEVVEYDKDVTKIIRKLGQVDTSEIGIVKWKSMLWDKKLKYLIRDIEEVNDEPQAEPPKEVKELKPELKPTRELGNSDEVIIRIKRGSNPESLTVERVKYIREDLISNEEAVDSIKTDSKWKYIEESFK